MVRGCLAHAASIENEPEEEIDGNVIANVERTANSVTNH